VLEKQNNVEISPKWGFLFELEMSGGNMSYRSEASKSPNHGFFRQAGLHNFFFKFCLCLLWFVLLLNCFEPENCWRK